MNICIHSLVAQAGVWRFRTAGRGLLLFALCLANSANFVCGQGETVGTGLSQDALSTVPEQNWEAIKQPATQDPTKLLAFVREIQKRQPATRDQYIEMQTAIKRAAELALTKTANRTTDQFFELEDAYLASSVMLMGNEGPEAQQATMKKFADYLTAKSDPNEKDLRMVLLAGQNLEQINNPQAAKEAYLMVADILEKKNKENLSVWVEMLKANARRLDSLGKVFEFKGKTLDGGDFDLSSNAGKFTLLYFWASWERSVSQEYPYMKKLYDYYHGKGFEIVAISFDDDRDKLEKFVAENNVPWINIWNDDEFAASKLAQEHGINAIPSLILLDKENKVIHLEARGLVLGKLLSDLIEPMAATETAAGEK